MRADGLVDEVAALAARPAGISRTADQAIGYKETLAYLRGDEPSLDAALDLAVRRTRKFARRQRVWFRRDPRDPVDRGAREYRRPRPGHPGNLVGIRSRPHPMTTMHLSKLHATGNDFLVRLALDDGSRRRSTRRTVAALCDRHRGIGADGLITVTPGRDGADFTMTLVNADGGLAEMSGNGIRCLAWVVAEAGLASDDELVVDTGGGRRTVCARTRPWLGRRRRGRHGRR